MLCLSQMCLTLFLSLQRPLVLRIGRTSKRRLATCFSTPTLSQSAQCRSRPTDRGWCAVARTVTSQAPKVTEWLPQTSTVHFTEPHGSNSPQRAWGLHRSCSKVPQLCVRVETQLHVKGVYRWNLVRVCSRKAFYEWSLNAAVLSAEKVRNETVDSPLMPRQAADSLVLLFLCSTFIS